MSSVLHKLSERWFQAWLEKDATIVERLAADDYIYVTPNGSTLDRQAIQAIIRSPGYRLDHGRRTEVVVRALGPEAAMVRHRYEVSMIGLIEPPVIAVIEPVRSVPKATSDGSSNYRFSPPFRVDFSVF
jgi:hypothetical protein